MKRLLFNSFGIGTLIFTISFSLQSFDGRKIQEDPPGIKCRETISTDYCVSGSHRFKSGCANNIQTDDCKSKEVKIPQQ